MRQLSSLFLLLPLCLSVAKAQPSTPPSAYKTFVVQGEKVLLLTKTGTIRRFSLATGELESTLPTAVPIVALGVDKAGNVVAGDTSHLLQQYDAQKQLWHPIGSYANTLTDIVFTSQNQCLLVTNKGIVDPKNQDVYFPDTTFSQNKSVRYTQGWLQPPVCFMDRKDRLWLGFDYGEWGGDVFVFDTDKRVFVPIQAGSVRMDMNPVSAFCEDAEHVYMSGGLTHFLTHGSILTFTNVTASRLLFSEDRETPVNVTMTDPKTGRQRTSTLITWKGGLQIGPIAYNPSNNSLYIYSQNGFYKGNLSNRLSDIKNWQNVLKPTLRWTSGRPNALGPAMNVLKMAFTNRATLLFLTEQDGLGIYGGKKLRYIK